MGLFDVLTDVLVLGATIKIIDKSSEPLFDNKENKLINKDRESLFKW